VWQRKRSSSSRSNGSSGKCGGGGGQTAAQLHFVRESARVSDAQWYTIQMQLVENANNFQLLKCNLLLYAITDY